MVVNKSPQASWVLFMNLYFILATFSYVVWPEEASHSPIPCFFSAFMFHHLVSPSRKEKHMLVKVTLRSKTKRFLGSKLIFTAHTQLNFL